MCLAGPGPARSQAAGRRKILKEIIISRIIYSFSNHSQPELRSPRPARRGRVRWPSQLAPVTRNEV